MKNIVEDRKKNFWSLGLIFLLFGVTLHFLLKEQELSQLLLLMSRADMLWLFTGLAFMILFFSLEALPIRLLLMRLGYEVGFGRCYTYSLIDFYFSSITPGCCGGQPSQIYFMNRDGIPVGASSLALLLFNLAYHLAALLIIGLVLILEGSRILGEMGVLRYGLFYGAAAQLFLVAVFMAVVFSPGLMPRIAGAGLRLLAWLRVIKEEAKAREKLEEQLGEYRRGAVFIRHNPGVMSALVLLALLHLAVYYSAAYWVYLAFGLRDLSPWTLIGMQALLALSLESLPIPGGAGMMEAAFVLLYTDAFGESLVLSAMLLTRGINYYFWLGTGGLVTALRLHQRPKEAVKRLESRRAAALVKAAAPKEPVL